MKSLNLPLHLKPRQKFFTVILQVPFVFKTCFTLKPSTRKLLAVILQVPTVFRSYFTWESNTRKLFAAILIVLSLSTLTKLGIRNEQTLGKHSVWYLASGHERPTHKFVSNEIISMVLDILWKVYLSRNS